MTKKKFTLEAEETEDGSWEGEMTIESEEGQSTVEHEYDTLHELMSDLQTKAVFNLAEIASRKSQKSHERD